MKRIILTLAVPMFCSCWLCGCSSLQCYRVPAVEQFSIKQNVTQKALADYLKTANWKKRVLIETAVGESEIQASRVFAAFRVYAISKFPPDVMNSARQELFRNSRLTLAVLSPVIDERASPLDEVAFQGLSYPPVSSLNVDAYLSLCASVAQVERDGYAAHILSQLARHQDLALQQQARSLLVHVQEQNYRTKSDAYKTTGRWEDLHWLADYYLKPTLPRAEVENVLGPGRQVGDSVLVYHGKREFPNGNQLRLEFRDGELSSFRWED